MKSLGASPDLKAPGKKSTAATADVSDADSNSPSKRKTRALVDEKAALAKNATVTASKDGGKKPATKSTDEEVTTEKAADSKKKKVALQQLVFD